MLFWLKKILTLPFLPLYFSLFAGGLGWLLLFSRQWQKLGRVLVGVAVLALAIFSNKSVARWLITPLETQFPAIPEARSAAGLPATVAACRAIVVLGGGNSESPELSHVDQLSSSALGRLAEGVRLARLLPDARLIVSGYNGPRTYSHAQILSEAAQSLGIGSSRILRFDDTRDTDDEARAILRQLGTEPFLLVTSAWHLPRAMALCQKAGLHPIAAPADFMDRTETDAGWPSFVFDLGSLERSTKAIHERLGLFWAQLRGRG